MHPWHDVDPNYDGELSFRGVVEIPKGDRNKYELDKETGLLKIDRILHSAVVYPGSYGFIPRTLAPDGDPLDVLILAQEPIAPLTIARCRAVGVLRMLDEGTLDDKIVAIHEGDPEFTIYRDIRELPPHRMQEIERFFKDYKALEEKTVKVRTSRGLSAARKMLKKAFKDYERFMAQR